MATAVTSVSSFAKVLTIELTAAFEALCGAPELPVQAGKPDARVSAPGARSASRRTARDHDNSAIILPQVRESMLDAREDGDDVDIEELPRRFDVDIAYPLMFDDAGVENDGIQTTEHPHTGLEGRFVVLVFPDVTMSDEQSALFDLVGRRRTL